ncbi:MAG: hypothetical protein ABIY52_07190 [Gemmatimonadaceae bacterium]
MKRSHQLVIATLAFASACAGAGSPSSAPAPAGTSPAGAPSSPVQVTWRTRTAEHLDVWLHSYALITPDTTLVPYFRRGYRSRIDPLRKQKGTTLIDANRDRLLAGVTANPSLATSGQFLPLYFESYEQMRQVVDLFVRNNGNPGNSQDPNIRMFFAILGSAFQTASDRDWLRTFSAAVDDESRKFYHDYWTSEMRSRAPELAHVDSLWQRTWRPSLQRFLNNTQQQNGELYLSLPLGGEGRTIHFAKTQNAVAGPFPETESESEHVLYVMAHEITGQIASTVIADNTTPADQRAGLTSRYEQAAAVRAGAMLLEKAIPSAVAGYMRYYLQQAGRTPPADPRAMFTSTFAVTDSIRDAIARQLDVVLGGI